MAFLEAKDVCVNFNGTVVLENVTFAIDKGDVVSIIGPNGSGKTTLIRAILGIIPYRGSIMLDGKTVASQIERIGYVPQRFDFDRTFPLSVWEFLTIYSRNKALRDELCSEFGVAELMNAKLGSLSGGQLQRILIISAMLKTPQLLILDEPTSGIDIEGTASFYEMLRHINTEHNQTIIHISHEINMVATTANKVICLNKNVYCCGEPAKVLTEEMLTKLYTSHFELRDHGHGHIHGPACNHGN